MRPFPAIFLDGAAVNLVYMGQLELMDFCNPSRVNFTVSSEVAGFW